ncbi:hypothetical protein BgiMline_026866 [Biomphalaria glabrata]
MTSSSNVNQNASWATCGYLALRETCVKRVRSLARVSTGQVEQRNSCREKTRQSLTERQLITHKAHVQLRLLSGEYTFFYRQLVTLPWQLIRTRTLVAATKKPLTTQDGAEAHVNSAHRRQRSAVLSSLPESKRSLPALCSRPSSRARQGQERGWVFEKKEKSLTDGSAFRNHMKVWAPPTTWEQMGGNGTGSNRLAL